MGAPLRRWPRTGGQRTGGQRTGGQRTGGQRKSTAANEIGERTGGVAASAERDGEIRPYLSDDARPHQEIPDAGRLGIEELRDEIVGDSTTIVGRTARCLPGFRKPARRGGCEPEACCPATGRLGMGVYRLARKVDAVRCKEVVDLRADEREIAEADLGHHACQPVAVQGQSGIDPADDHQPQVRARMAEEEIELGGNCRPSQHLSVVKDDDDRLAPVGQCRGQADQQGMLNRVRSCGHTDGRQLHAVMGKARQEVGPEDSRVGILGVEADPHERCGRPAGNDPRVQQHRLPRPRQGTDERQRPVHAAGHDIQKPVPHDHPWTQRRYPELRGHDRVAIRCHPLRGIRPLRHLSQRVPSCRVSAAFMNAGGWITPGPPEIDLPMSHPLAPPRAN